MSSPNATVCAVDLRSADSHRKTSIEVQPTTTSFFRSGNTAVAVQLEHDPWALIEQWKELRFAMAREHLGEFERGEWAYLMTFLEPCRLRRLFADTFGERIEAQLVQKLFVPRGNVAVWLPNNVSLLGPLTLILLSLVGAPVRLKKGSRSRDLCSSFLEYAKNKLGPGPLQDFLEQRVEVCELARDSEALGELSQWAQTRIVFGSDSAARDIDALPHSTQSQTIAFVDRSSEVWLPDAEVDDSVLRDLIRVFSVYGRTGCTSPRTVVLLNDDSQACERLAQRLEALWLEETNPAPDAHIASQSLMSQQWGRALGLCSQRVGLGDATLVLGPPDAEIPGGERVMFLTSQPLENRLATLSENTQTIGHAFGPDALMDLVPKLGRTSAVRLVPIAKMHDFAPFWDGIEFWRQLFRAVEISV